MTPPVKRFRFTETQIVAILEEHEAGVAADREPELEPAAIVILRAGDREPELEPAAIVILRASDREPELEPAAIVILRASQLAFARSANSFGVMLPNDRWGRFSL